MILKNGTLYSMENEIPFVGDLQTLNGKITAIGDHIVPLEDETVIDCTGKYLFPGFIDAHSHLGLWEDSIGFEGIDGNEMTDPITPHLRAIDGINPLDITFKEAREGGITCAVIGPGSANVIGGQFAAVKTHGNRIDDMILKSPLAIKCAFGENPKRVYNEKKTTPMTRMGIAAEMRKAFLLANQYIAKKEEALKIGDPSKMPPFDMKYEALIPLMNREIPLKAHVHRTDDIFTAIRIAKEFNLRLSLEHCTDGHLIAAQLAEENIPAIVGPSFGHRTKFELKNKTFDTAGILANAGVKVAITTDSPVIPIHHLPLCAALAVKSGMNEWDALRAITITAAQIAEIDSWVGSLSIGKDADIVVWNQHPFNTQSSPELVLINGKFI